jgi:DNA polymerase elongation subunit (family B)
MVMDIKSGYDKIEKAFNVDFGVLNESTNQ